ncbi:hypothetical protein AMC90_CH01119 [Rhizobium phaseoli]|nr:hypothetical protein AMC90_CH01119 [Rhizobium phaseoli]
MKSMNNRQVRIPGPREHDVAEHCRKFGIGPAEEKKLKSCSGHTRHCTRSRPMRRRVSRNGGNVLSVLPRTEGNSGSDKLRGQIYTRAARPWVTEYFRSEK